MKKLLLLIVFGLLPLCLLTTLGCSSNLPHSLLDSAYVTHKIPADYLKLLHMKGDKGDTSKTGKFSFLYSTQSKFRNTISCFMYDQKYFLQIYKMDSLARQPLQKSVEEAFTDFNHTISTPYSLDNTSPVEYLFKLTKPVKPLKIYLKINGTDNKILAKNDTVAYYYSRLRGFALTYNQADFFDIIGRVKEGNISEHVWHELLFLRRNNGLYFLTMCPKEAKTDYIPGLLYKVIK